MKEEAPVCECVCVSRKWADMVWWKFTAVLRGREVNEPVWKCVSGALLLLLLFVGEIFPSWVRRNNDKLQEHDPKKKKKCNSRNSSFLPLKTSNIVDAGGGVETGWRWHHQSSKRSRKKAFIFSQMTTIICTKRQQFWHFKVDNNKTNTKISNSLCM